MCTCMCKYARSSLVTRRVLDGIQNITTCFQLNGIAPRYICDLIRKKASIRSSLRSNDLTLLEVPRTKCKTFDDRAFAFAGPSK